MLTDKNILKEKGQLCVDYLVRNIQADGSFVYSVNIKTGKKSFKYNILRHAGTLYELCLWLKLHPDNHVLTALEKPFAFLLGHLKKWNNGTCIVENNQVKLGGSALTLMALVAYSEISENEELITIMEPLADFIISCQTVSGDFNSKYAYDTGILSSFRSDYYPGQALLALANLYKIKPDERLFNAASKGMECYTRKPPIFPKATRVYASWYAKALRELLTIRSNKNFKRALEIIVEINLGFIIPEQNLNLPAEKKTYTSASMASLGEALVAGLLIYREDDDEPNLSLFSEGLTIVFEFCLALQVTAGKNQDPRFVGGIIRDSKTKTIRIDYVQHLLSNITSVISIADDMPILRSR